MNRKKFLGLLGMGAVAAVTPIAVKAGQQEQAPAPEVKELESETGLFDNVPIQPMGVAVSWPDATTDTKGIVKINTKHLEVENPVAIGTNVPVSGHVLMGNGSELVWTSPAYYFVVRPYEYGTLEVTGTYNASNIIVDSTGSITATSNGSELPSGKWSGWWS